MRIVKPKNMPPRSEPAILFLDQPDAHMIVVGEFCHIMCGSKSLYVNPNTIEAMIKKEWIPEHPQALGGPFAKYSITGKGRAAAQRLREDKIGLHQLELELKHEIEVLQLVS